MLQLVLSSAGDASPPQEALAPAAWPAPLAASQEPAPPAPASGLASGSSTAAGAALSGAAALPNKLFCPLTLEVMVDPVVAADGQSYSRAAIAGGRPNGWCVGRVVRRLLKQAAGAGTTGCAVQGIFT
jgi:hypothetical protein